MQKSIQTSNSLWGSCVWVSDLITVLRACLAVPLYFTFREFNILPSVLLLVGAWISDVLDGWLARRSNHCTKYGSLLDTAADCAVGGGVAWGLVSRGDLSVLSLVTLAALMVGCGYVMASLIIAKASRCPHPMSAKFLGAGLFLAALLLIFEYAAGEHVLWLAAWGPGALVLRYYHKTIGCMRRPA